MSISSVDDRWSKHLPHELVDMIVKRLGLVDSKTFAAVCSSWRSVTMASQWLATQFPCILQSLPYEDCSAGTSCYSLYSPCEDRAANNLKFPKEIVDRDGMAPYCSGCFGSWLIIAEHSRQSKTVKSYFFNPVSGARIALPPHTNRSFFVRDDETGWNEKVVVKTVASSDPTDPNCIVAALTLHAHKLAFCRPNDASWTLQYRPDSPEEGGFGLTDLHFHEGELYATVGRMIDAVLMFDPIEVLSQSQCGSDEAAFKGKLLLVSPLQFHTTSMHNPSFSLITSFSGEMALVLKNERILRKRNYKEVSFLVLKGKVDKTLHIVGSAGYCDWEEMNNLGEQAIFIGDIGAKTLIAMSKPTNSMPVIDKLGGLGSGNCIYFTDEEDDNIGVYNLADGTLKYQLTGGLQQAHSKVTGHITSLTDVQKGIPLGVLDPRKVKKGQLHYKIAKPEKAGSKFYRYMGSLTTPPCAEEVIWHINKKVQTASIEQVKLLQDAVFDFAANNARPLQPLNGRGIKLYGDYH